MEDDKRVYGYVNGKPAYSADEYVYAISDYALSEPYCLLMQMA